MHGEIKTGVCGIIRRHLTFRREYIPTIAREIGSVVVIRCGIVRWSSRLYHSRMRVGGASCFLQDTEVITEEAREVCRDLSKGWMVVGCKKVAVAVGQKGRRAPNTSLLTR